MTWRTGLAVLIPAMVLLSGCTGSDDGGPAGSSSNGPLSSAPEPQPTEGFGSVAGNLTDEEARPIPGAHVGLLATDFEATTDESGRFTFNGVEPGEYNLFAEKIGFVADGRVVTVVAGEVADASFSLTSIPVPKEPYPDLQIFDGYLACSWNPYYGVNRCGDALGGNRDHFPIVMDPAFKVYEIIVELLWEPGTEVTGQELEVDVCPPQDPTTGGAGVCLEPLWYCYDYGASPLKLILPNDPEYAGDPCNHVPDSSLQYEVWITAGTFGYTDPSIQQDVDIYVTVCYDAPCGPDYSALPPM